MNPPNGLSLQDRYALPTALEAARLHAVDQLFQLDTEPEDRFARVTSMARCALDVPMAAVSLLAEDRQWFKQCDGMALGGFVPRGQTVCQATVARFYRGDVDPLHIIEDTWQSEFSELPAVQGEGGIRFYAGYPLVGPGGHAVGTFCVYDTRPRTLDASQRRTLLELAHWAERELQNSDDLDRAAAVQRQLLPAPLIDLPGYTVCGLCVPAFAVGGDFYDHYPVSGGAVFTIADVMGKGLAAAILTATVRSALRGASRAIDWTGGGDVDIADAVNSVGAQLAGDLDSTETFVTLMHMRLRAADGALDYVDAGHGFAVLIGADGQTRPLQSRGLPMGVSAEETWTSQRLMLTPGDTVVIASDGLLDLVGDGTDMRPALEFLAGHRDPTELCATLRTMTGDRPCLDDVTLVAIRREVRG